MKQAFYHTTFLYKLAVLLVAVFFTLNKPVAAQYATDTSDGKVIIEERYSEEETEDEEEEEENPFRTKNETGPFSVSQRNLPPGYAKRIKEDKAFWYADVTPETKPAPVYNKDENNGTDKQSGNQRTDYETKIDTSGFSDYTGKEKKESKQPAYTSVSKNNTLQAILWIVILAGFAGILIWYLVTNNIRFRRNKKEDTPLNAGEMPEDIFAINYLSEVDKAVAQGNYRLAIRLQYLRMLKAMAERNIINYKQDKTNLDYMMELQPTAYYQNFFRTTRHYEFAWYGNFTVSAETYALVRRGYDDFEKQITG